MNSLRNKQEDNYAVPDFDDEEEEELDASAYDNIIMALRNGGDCCYNVENKSESPRPK